MFLWLSILLAVTVSGSEVVVGPGCKDSVVRARSVGPIRIGMPIDSVKARCGILRDTIEYNEGEPGRVLYASVAGDTVRVEVLRDSSVDRLSVRSPRFTTPDGLHAGMSLRAFLRGRDVVEVGPGEGKVYLSERHHCGISFGLSDEAYARLPLTPAKLHRLPASTIIDLILVHGISVQGPEERCK